MRRYRLAVVVGLALVVPVAQSLSAPGGLTVTNYTNGDEIRFLCPLLRGTLADTAATSITVTNLSSHRPTREMHGLAYKGRFKALTELVPGPNRLVLRAGDEETRLTLTYKPQTNPYFVRAVYFVDSSGNTAYQTPFPNDPQDFRSKLDTALKLLQCFCAESFHDHGYDRRTFNLELDANGYVKVHVLVGDHDLAYYRGLNGGQLYDTIWHEIQKKLPNPMAHCLAIPAFTYHDPATGKTYDHTALGGGNLAVFGGGDLYAWPRYLTDAQHAFMDTTPVNPKQVLSDSIGRDTIWGNDATTMGAAMHELGHTFGLPHSEQPFDIMTRGFDRFNRFFTLYDPPDAHGSKPYVFRDDEVACWPPVSALALLASRYFALDARDWKSTGHTVVRLDPAAGDAIVQSDNGLRYVGVWKQSAKAGTLSEYPIDVPWRGPPVKTARVSLREIGRRLGTAQVAIHVIDAQGLDTTTSIKDLLAGPYVQAWHISPTTMPWQNHDAFPEVDAARLRQIETAAEAAPITRSPTPYLDLFRLAPGGKTQNVAAYAVRDIRAARARSIKILTGSDDALRMWLNGHVIAQVLALRGATPDSETTTAELQPGDNRLVVEVSQGDGGWGLFLRFKDDAGARLVLGDDGRLKPVDTTVDQRVLAMLRGPWVRRWRFAPNARPWPDRSRFLNLSANDLAALVASASKSPLSARSGDSSLVNFADHFPPGSRQDVAGYAVRHLRSAVARKIKLFTGSDDALRVWVNGKLVQQVLKLRGAKPDSESADARLVAGDNTLLVEVSQGGGDWGLYLRLADDRGHDLFLADDGTLSE